MARFVPGTDRPWDGDPANLAIDLADDVIDFQVALGVDLDGDGRVAADAADPGADEWLYNDPEDDPSDPRWARRARTPGLVRLTAETRAERPDPGYLAPPAGPLEDHRRATRPALARRRAPAALAARVGGRPRERLTGAPLTEPVLLLRSDTASRERLRKVS